MTDASFLALLASLLAMLSSRPGRAQLAWSFAGSVVGPVLAALALLAAKDPGDSRAGVGVRSTGR